MTQPENNAEFNLYKLRLRQAYPLDMKIELSVKRIKQWYEHYDGNVYASVSGKDSTVMLHLIREVAGLKGVPAVFVNTGLEYPEIVEHIRSLDNVIELRPEMTFKQVIEKYGYPVISKRIAYYIHQVRHAKPGSQTKKLRLFGLKGNGKISKMSKISEKWQFLCDAPFNVSHMCCHYLKRKPLDGYVKKNGQVPYIGMMASEGQQREVDYKLYGCNAYDQKRPRSTPIAFWTEKDIWEYIRRFNVPYSKVYDMGYQRTGCMFCMFGVHLESNEKTNNRFQLMQKTHPKQYNYCMDKLGCRRVLNYIGVPIEYQPKYDQMELF